MEQTTLEFEMLFKEAKKMNIPVIALLNTDCNLKQVNHPVVANDASVSSISLFLKYIKEAYTKLNLARTAIQQNLRGETRKVNDYIFIYNREFTLKDLIFPMKGSSIVILKTKDSVVYFRSVQRCATYLKEKPESIRLFLTRTKKELFKNKYFIDLVKSCELLETLEADNQQPSNIEIY